ncbi:MAG: carboxypeptidase regulatory-like domain-containing protein, partial [Phycisphaerales bacterium]
MRTMPADWDGRRTALLWLAVPKPWVRLLTLGIAYCRTWVGLVLRAALALSAAFVVGPAASARQPVATPPTDVDQTPPEVEGPLPSFVVVEGQITDHIGAGQAGVSVTARRKTADGTIGDVIATTTTDEFGDFVITAPEPIRGDIVVTFSKPLYADMTREVNVGDDEFPPYLGEMLEGKLVVIGRVVDALTDKPVAGASVNLKAQHQDWYENTDEQGHFTIKGVFPGDGELIVESEGYGREREPVARLEDFGEIIVSLKPERIVHIKMVDDSGEPIPGVTVECFDRAHDDFRTLVTDEKGTVTLRGVHFDAAALGVRLTHEEYVSSEGFDRQIVPPEQEVESTHRLVMARAGRITGRVTDAGTEKPVNGARLITGDEYSYNSPRDWASYTGNYTIRGVRPGRTTVTVHASGYAPDLKTVNVTAGGTAQLDFSLSEGATLLGTVKADDGKPVADAYVDATLWRGRSTLGLRAVTNAEGEFSITNAPRDEFEIVAMARDYGEVAKTVKVSPGKIVQITLPAGPDAGDPRSLPGLKPGDPVPDLTLTTLEGRVFSLADLKGKTVLLDFWATWCAPCIEDMPHLIAVYEKFGSRKDFLMIGISRDFEAAP